MGTVGNASENSSSVQIERIFSSNIIGDVKNNFTNSGKILATVNAENASGTNSTVKIYDSDGVFVHGISGNVTTFDNSGTISAKATAGDASEAGSKVYIQNINGVHVYGSITKFTNSGTISAEVTAKNASGTNSQVNINNDVNIESISAGVYIDGNVNNFTNSNSGSISAKAKAEDAIGGQVNLSQIYGVDFGNEYNTVDVKNFSNSGTISATATAGNASGSKVDINDIYGFKGYVNNFTNSGTISATATVENASGSTVNINDIYGVYVYGTNFNNSGTISAEVTAKNASGSTININDIYGFKGYVNNFTNSGTISATATVENASGSTVNIKDIYGVAVDNDDFTNLGTISATVTAGDASGPGSTITIDTVSGVAIKYPNSGANINNTGNILVDITAAKSAVVRNVAGIYIQHASDVILSNPGTVSVSINGPDPSHISNVRTLWIDDNSTVKLKGSFSIVFGTPGIDPSPDSSTNVDKRPIYVSNNSRLDLNNADLVAKIDSRNLKYDTKYYLIEKADTSTVTGQFGNLIRGYTNPEITVNWAGEDNGENAAVRFGYTPSYSGGQSLTTAMGYTASSIIASSFANTITGFSYDGFPTYFLSQKNNEVLLASSALVPVSLPQSEQRYGIFIMPVYTRVDASDLGFNADAYGFALGAGGRIADNLTATIYGGYSRVNLYFKEKGPRDEDQDIYIAGLTLSYAPKPYFVRLNTNFHWADHDYRGLTGLNYELAEKADYNSWGFNGELTGGYIFELGRLSLAPEMGIGYTYYNADDFHTKTYANPSLNRHYNTDSVDFFKGILGLYGAMKLGDVKQSQSTMYASLRLEQAFGDNDVSVISYVRGASGYGLKKDISNTTVAGQIGFSTKISNKFIFDVSGRGDLNADYNAFSGRAVVRYTF